MTKILFVSSLLVLAHSSAFGDDFCSKLRTVKDCAELSCRWIDAEQRCTDNDSNQSLPDENSPSEELALPGGDQFRSVSAE